MMGKKEKLGDLGEYLKGHDKGADDSAAGKPSKLAEMKEPAYHLQGYADGYVNGR